jgi:hypothetical protein
VSAGCAFYFLRRSIDSITLQEGGGWAGGGRRMSAGHEAAQYRRGMSRRGLGARMIQEGRGETRGGGKHDT